MTIKAGHYSDSIWYYFGFSLVEYQTGLSEKNIFIHWWLEPVWWGNIDIAKNKTRSFVVFFSLWWSTDEVAAVWTNQLQNARVVSGLNKRIV